MGTRSYPPWLRVIAAAFLFCMPSVGAAQAVLDAREGIDTGTAWESHHIQNCLRLHDHRFCFLSERVPWAPTDPAVQLPAVAPTRDATKPANEPLRISRAGLDVVRPRSPPIPA